MSKKNKRKNAEGTTNKKGQHRLNYKVTCDKCGKEFYPLIKEIAILKGCIIVSGFTCRCGAEYITTVTDNDLRKDMAKLLDLQDELKVIKRTIKTEEKEQERLRGFVPEDIKERNNKKVQQYELQIAELKACTIKRGTWLRNQYLEKHSH